MRRTLSILLALASLPAIAGVRLPVQGELLAAGAPVSGPVDLEFSLVDSVATELTCERFTAVPLTEGVFNVVLGDTANDCGTGLPVELDESLFVDQGHSLVMRFNGDSFTLPAGEASRAGFAALTGNATALEGIDAAALAPPTGIFRASAGTDTAAAAIAAAVGSGHPSPVVELGPGDFDLSAGLTIPDGLTLRGQGSQATRVLGDTFVVGDARIEALTIASTGFALTVGAPSSRVELRGVVVRATGVNPRGITVTTPSNAETRLVLINSRIELDGSGNSEGITGSVAFNLLLDSSAIEVNGTMNETFGLRLRGGGGVGFYELRDSRVVVDAVATVFAGAVEVDGAADFARIRSCDLRSTERVLNLNGGDTRVDSSRLSGAEIGFLNSATMVIGNSSVEATVAVTAGFSAPLTCRHVLNAGTLTPTGDDCN